MQTVWYRSISLREDYIYRDCILSSRCMHAMVTVHNVLCNTCHQ